MTGDSRIEARPALIEVTSIASLRDRLGHEVAVSDWLDVTQERIDRFAEATEDVNGSTSIRLAPLASCQGRRRSRTAS